jgi:hypothetical protein
MEGWRDGGMEGWSDGAVERWRDVERLKLRLETNSTPLDFLEPEAKIQTELVVHLLVFR